jgi:hypothetical protein
MTKVSRTIDGGTITVKGVCPVLRLDDAGREEASRAVALGREHVWGDVRDFYTLDRLASVRICSGRGTPPRAVVGEAGSLLI